MGGGLPPPGWSLCNRRSYLVDVVPALVCHLDLVVVSVIMTAAVEKAALALHESALD